MSTFICSSNLPEKKQGCCGVTKQIHIYNQKFLLPLMSTLIFPFSAVDTSTTTLTIEWICVLYKHSQHMVKMEPVVFGKFGSRRFICGKSLFRYWSYSYRQPNQRGWKGLHYLVFLQINAVCDWNTALFSWVINRMLSPHAKACRFLLFLSTKCGDMQLSNCYDCWKVRTNIDSRWLWMWLRGP